MEVVLLIIWFLGIVLLVTIAAIARARGWNSVQVIHPKANIKRHLRWLLHTVTEDDFTIYLIFWPFAPIFITLFLLVYIVYWGMYKIEALARKDKK